MGSNDTLIDPAGITTRRRPSPDPGTKSPPVSSTRTSTARSAGTGAAALSSQAPPDNAPSPSNRCPSGPVPASVGAAIPTAGPASSSVIVTDAAARAMTTPVDALARVTMKVSSASPSASSRIGTLTVANPAFAATVSVADAAV